MGIADKKVGVVTEETIKVGGKTMSKKTDPEGIEETAEEKIRRLVIEGQEEEAEKLRSQVS